MVEEGDVSDLGESVLVVTQEVEKEGVLPNVGVRDAEVSPAPGDELIDAIQRDLF